MGQRQQPQPQQPSQAALPTFVLDPKTGSLSIEGESQTPGTMPTLGFTRPPGGADPTLNWGEGILPTLLGILAAPFTNGMSLPAAMATTGAAGGFGEFAEQQLDDKPSDLSDIIWEASMSAAPTAVGRGFNTARRGTRMIRGAVAEGEPAASAEALTRAAKQTRVGGINTQAFAKVQRQIDDMNKVLYNGQMVPLNTPPPPRWVHGPDAWRQNIIKQNQKMITLPPRQAQALQQRIQEAENLLKRLESIPAVGAGEGHVRMRVDPRGFGGVTVSPFRDPSTRLAVGQTLDKIGPTSQWTIEGILRALTLGNDLDNTQNLRREGR